MKVLLLPLVVTAVLLMVSSVVVVSAHELLDLSSWEGLNVEQALARTENDKKLHKEAFAQFGHHYLSTKENFQNSPHYEHIRRIQGSKMSCSECELVIEILQSIVNSPSSVNSTIDLIDVEVCDKLKNATSSKVAACKDVVSLAFKTVLPLVFKGVASLAWDIPKTMCADVVKACAVPCCADAPTVPQQLHLSFANASNWYSSLGVTWVTQVETPGAQVRYAALSSPGISSTSAEILPTRTYTFGGWIGQIHYAQMTGLSPSTTYWYQVGSDQFGWSTNYTFTTMSAHVGQKGVQSLRMFAIADMGWGPNSNSTLVSMINMLESNNNNSKINAVVFPGDISYEDAQEASFDFFMNKFEPIFARVPVMYGPGNHEFFYDFAAYKQRIALNQVPAGFGAKTDAMYYRQQIGTAHFVMLDSETAFDTADIDKDQVQWATDVMNAFPKSTQLPWLVVAQHRPLYCTEHGLQCGLFSDILKMQVEGLYNEKKVDTVLSGHIHTHFVTWPIAQGGVVTQRNYKEPTAPVYVVHGNAGNREGNGSPKPEPWLNEGYSTIGFTVLEFNSVGNQHTLTISGYASATGQQLDQIVIEKTL